MNISKILKPAELIFIAALIIGLVLNMLDIEVNSVLQVSLIGLGVTSFLSAFVPIDFQPDENQTFGFQHLFGWTILPKVLWISTAITFLGIGFYFLNLGNDGYMKLLSIGTSTIAIGGLLTIFLVLGGTKHMKIIVPILLRAVPAMMFGLYIQYF